MPPQPNTDGLIYEHHYMLEAGNKAASLSANLYSRAMAVAPTSVKSFADTQLEKNLIPMWEDRLKQPLTAALTTIDKELDGRVITPVASMYQGCSDRADKVIDSIGQTKDAVANTAAFVKGAVKDASEKGESDESVEEEGEAVVRATYLSTARDKVGSVVAGVTNRYTSLVTNVDSKIDEYLSEEETSEEACESLISETKEAVVTPLSLTRKAMRRIPKKLRTMKKRTVEELDKIVHVDLITYAAQTIDDTRSLTYKLAVKKPLEAANVVSTKYSNAKEAVTTKAVQTKALVTTKVSEKAVAAKGVVEPVLTQMYNEKLQAVYSRNSERVMGAFKYVVDTKNLVTTKFTDGKNYTYEKVLVVYNDGSKALVEQLREEGYLPQVVSIASVYTAANGQLVAIRDRLAEANTKLFSLSLTEIREEAEKFGKEAIKASEAKIQVVKDQVMAMYKVVLAASQEVKEFLEGTQEAAAALFAALSQYVTTKCLELWDLLKSAPSLAQQQIAKLYHAFVAVHPEIAKKLLAAIESAKALPTTLDTACTERFPEATATTKNTIKKSWEWLAEMAKKDFRGELVAKVRELLPLVQSDAAAVEGTVVEEAKEDPLFEKAMLAMGANNDEDDDEA